MTSTLPRGVRNHNPLNIRINAANKWQGKLPDALNTDGAFEQFGDPIMGLRAGAVLLINHFERRGADTLAKLIPIWAPASENDVEAYVGSVARATGLDPQAPLDLYNPDTLRGVMAAMVRHENGVQPYTTAQLDKAMTLAGIEPKRKPLRATRTVQGGQIAGVGTTGAIGVEAVQEIVPPPSAVEAAPTLVDTAQTVLPQAKEQLSALAPMLDIAKYALLVVTLVGIILMVVARVDDRRRGLR